MAALTDVELLGALLGRGARAQVRLVRHKESGCELALKTVDLSEVADFATHSRQVVAECEVHLQLRHPNIVR
jgi:serine/threonine protein kinase